MGSRIENLKTTGIVGIASAIVAEIGVNLSGEKNDVAQIYLEYKPGSTALAGIVGVIITYAIIRSTEKKPPQ